MCKRWAAAASAPELLSHVEADFGHFYLDVEQAPAELGAAAAARARSLLRWLHRHSHAVHSLKLCVTVPDSCSQLQKAELAALCDGRASACSVEQLALQFHRTDAVVLGSWAQHMRSLKALEVSVSGPLQLLVSLDHLTKLERLDLYANELLVAGGVRLPTSLTDLRLTAMSLDGSFQVGSRCRQIATSADHAWPKHAGSEVKPHNPSLDRHWLLLSGAHAASPGTSAH